MQVFCAMGFYTSVGLYLVVLSLSQMSDVKRLPERLECMVFRVRFPEEISELQPVRP